MANAINSLSYGDGTYTFTLPYGVCSTAADTAAKTVTVDNFSLETGAVVVVKFTYANSVASPTLNVNSTGAKPIYRYGTTAVSTGTTTSGWIAGAVQTFIYDGTGWVREYWNNTTYSNVSLGQGYATCSTAAATTAKVATLSSYSLTTGGIVAVKFTYAVPASATLNINSKGAKAIYYRGAAITAGVIGAGDTATFIYNGTYYHLLSIDRDDNTTYSAATTSAAGLMSAADKTKLDGIATSANAYTHPSYTARTGKPTANQTPAFGGTATVSQITSDATGHVTAATDRTITIPSTLSNGSTTAGLIKTSSTVTSSSGYTACPVISGVPYYKDTNTTYTLSSFGVTATSTELNYVDGVTSNIQTQLDTLSSGKVPGIESTNYPGCYYRTVDGATEWINPPMVLGVEYRTTERYEGKVVYVTLTKYNNSATIGSASGSVDINIPHGITGWEGLVRCIAKLDAGYVLPYVTVSGGLAVVQSVTTTNIVLRLQNSTFESRSWYFLHFYTKG